MHCHACGSQVPDDVKFCTICGASFTDDLDDSPEKKPLEAPIIEVEQTDAQPDPFAEELEAAAEELPQDDPFFIPPVQTPGFGDAATAAAPASEEENEDWMDPKSPDFDPRKFAGLPLEEFQPMTTAVETEDEPEAAAQPAAGDRRKKRRAKQMKEPKQKNGRGGLAVLIVALVLVVLAGAAGVLYWLTMPVKDAVAQSDLAAYLSLAPEEAVTSFSVDSRETSRLHRQDTLWCAITTEDPGVRASRSYVMNYRLTREGWILAAVDDHSTENWTTEPLSGASAEEAALALVGCEIEFDDTYTYTLTEADAAAAQILDQTTDLASRVDLLRVSVSAVDDLVGWTAEADLELIFENGWIFGDFRPDAPQLEFKPGMAFDLTEEDFLAVLAANPIPFAQPADDVTATVVTDGEEQAPAASAAQTIKVDKDAVSELTVTETAFDITADTQTVLVSFKLDKQVAKLSVEAALTYVFEDGWRIDTITYVPTVEEIVLDGEWKGTYTESEGRIPGVTLTIAQNEDGTDNNVFAFGPSEQSPYFFTGKYYVSDEADPKTLAVDLKATDWVLYYNPGGVALVSLEGGFLMIDEAKITDGSTFELVLQRTVIETETEEAPDEALIARAVETAEVLDRPGQAALPAMPEAPELEPETEAGPEPETEATGSETEVTEPETTETETQTPDELAEPEQTPDDQSDAAFYGDPNDPNLGPNDTPIF
ncbi:MAG: zinc ribbon domain-containing protein [Oscillospiraceae bacterium]|nr:zinc ribbon domain-containing protein [Oscillospiraceae bacterium]